MGHLHEIKRSYRDLRKNIDKTPAGMPEGPAVYEILKILFTEEEAALASRLPVVPASIDDLAVRLQENRDSLKLKLDRMADRGLVLDIRNPKNKKAFYMLAPPVIGFFEFSMMRVRTDIPQKELAHQYQRYTEEDSTFMKGVFGGETVYGRTLVNENAIDPENATYILDYERATELVKKSNGGGISMCYCRHKAGHLGAACDKSVETCISLSGSSEYLIRHNFARRASEAELLELLDKSRHAGLVQICDNVRNRPSFICNCCGCCCNMLQGINLFGIPHAVTTSNVIAHNSRTACVGCGRCARTCPVGAISLFPVPYPERKKYALAANVDESICLGCGLCAATCNKKAMRMVPRAKRVITPENTVERVVNMALERGKLQHMLFSNPERLSHRTLNRFFGVFLNLSAVKKTLLSKQLKSHFVQAMISGVLKKKRNWVRRV